MVTALLIWNAGCAMMYLSTLKAAQTSEQHILAKSSSEDVLVAAMLAQNLSTATAGSTAPRATLAIGPGMVADAGMYSTLVATPPSKHPPSVASHLRYDTTSLSGHSSQHSVVEISDNDNDNDSDDDDDDEGDRTSAEANGDRGPDPAHGIVTVGAPVAATTATDGSWARWFRPAQPVTYGVTNPSNPSTPSIPDFHRFSGAAVGDAGRAARPPGSLAGAPSHRMSFLTDITHAPSTALEPPPSIVAFPIGPRGTAPFQPVDAGLVPARGRSLHRDVVDPGSHGAEAAAAAAHARSLSRERVTVWQADVPLTQPPDRFF
ncbi:hypothetical protein CAUPRSCDRAFT_12196 [Caulochytrium protostelioides]|nr:hypothetical protein CAUPRSCDRAFT_12196 [Caulochytrium protostelioides]